jgi:hypothetical protein
MRSAKTTLRAAFASLAIALTGLALLAPAAFAADGEGLYGKTNDKVITFFCFGVMIFFAVLVTVLSLIQGRLDARKARRRSDLDRLS